MICNFNTKSLMNILNIKGSKMEPCGNPLNSTHQSLLLPATALDPSFASSKIGSHQLTMLHALSCSLYMPSALQLKVCVADKSL